MSDYFGTELVPCGSTKIVVCDFEFDVLATKELNRFCKLPESDSSCKRGACGCLWGWVWWRRLTKRGGAGQGGKAESEKTPSERIKHPTVLWRAREVWAPEVKVLSIQDVLAKLKKMW